MSNHLACQALDVELKSVKKVVDTVKRLFSKAKAKAKAKATAKAGA